MSDVPTLQSLVDWANIGVVVSLALSFVFGAASIWLGGKLGRLKDAQSETAQRNFELALATQQERAANAEKSVLELQQQQRPRRIPMNAIIEVLKGKAAGTVIIFCDPSVPDAYDPLGMELYLALEATNWTVQSMRSAPAEPFPRPGKGPMKAIAPAFRQGVTLEGPKLEDCEGQDTPYCSLWRAFKASGLQFQAVLEPGLSKDTFRILIGPRPLLSAPPSSE